MMITSHWRILKSTSFGLLAHIYPLFDVTWKWAFSNVPCNGKNLFWQNSKKNHKHYFSYSFHFKTNITIYFKMTHTALTASFKLEYTKSTWFDNWINNKIILKFYWYLHFANYFILFHLIKYWIYIEVHDLYYSTIGRTMGIGLSFMSLESEIH